MQQPEEYALPEGKAAKKLNPSKINHPNSRKAQQYVKFKNKEAKRDKKKLTHFVKLNSQGEKVLWFRDNLDPEAEQCTPFMVDELIEKYLGRFDEEMSLIQSVKPYEQQKYASRRDQIRHIMEDERNEYNGCGFEIPDILNKTHLEALRKWTGELRYLQNIPLVRYSKTYLLGNDEKL
ncbi:hypothetical protein V9T40_010094 [Parthenolecanium corni]|uniref:Translation machinery-associated protein 16 n=1 Tax=Parthenolecanium corni TaxID=536013 RepID=A0AAN9TLN1_9HEMI